MVQHRSSKTSENQRCSKNLKHFIAFKLSLVTNLCNISSDVLLPALFPIAPTMHCLVMVTGEDWGFWWEGGDCSLDYHTNGIGRRRRRTVLHRKQKDGQHCISIRSTIALHCPFPLSHYCSSISTVFSIHQ